MLLFYVVGVENHVITPINYLVVSFKPAQKNRDYSPSPSFGISASGDCLFAH